MPSSLRADYVSKHPDFPWLEAGQPGPVGDLLHRLGWIDADESVLEAEKAGEGNMNLTLRVRTPRRAVILKQSRPWVEKYDEIEAPWDRNVSEQRFYQRISGIPSLASMMPRFLGADAEARVLLLEDLAPAEDMSDLYGGAKPDAAVLEALGSFLLRLHEETGEDGGETFANTEMRRLNHAHIFHLPLSDELNLPLDDFEPGLGEAAQRLKRSSAFVDRIRQTGERYLAPGSCLVHGDYFPGSWLRTEQGVRIIDPEFSFRGDPEFDLGVAVAHLALAGCSLADAARLLTAGGGERRDRQWIARYAAAEVMRRLIGVAQLPIPPSRDGWRASMLEKSARVADEERWEAFWS